MLQVCSQRRRVIPHPRPRPAAGIIEVVVDEKPLRDAMFPFFSRNLLQLTLAKAIITAA